MKQSLYERLIQYILDDQDRFYRVAYSYTRHQEDALDAVQSAVCKALEAHERIKNADAIRTWFYKILINECLTVLKKRGRVVLTADTAEQEEVPLPVIGGVARILTFRSYETEKDDIAVSVEIPTIEMIAADTGITVDGINQEILERCEQYARDALLRAEEYRTAFLETGGTLDEWAEHNIKITTK